MLQLIILGLLLDGDRHPYEVMQIMKERNMESYIKINYGTLYYNFEKLLERGDIAVKEIVQEERRPDKTIYRITDPGRARFQELLAKQFFDEGTTYPPLYPALMFARFTDEATVREAMLQKRVRQEAVVARLQSKIDSYEGKIYWGSMQIMRHAQMHAQTEIEWIDQFLQELDDKGVDASYKPIEHNR